MSKGETGMELEFWGVRGTMPVGGREFGKYGGHTLCACVTSAAGEMVIVDAGTGIKRLGEKIMEGAGSSGLHLYVLLTHFHLDHIIGLPFFAPLYAAGAGITFYSPFPPKKTEKQLAGLMGGRYFPVAFRETQSAKTFKKIPENGLAIGNFAITSCPLHHPQGSVAYRIEAGESSLVVATDTEPPEGRLDERLTSFARGADVFVCDATFTPAEYGKRQGWG
ncbi:MAG: MBL fold metallo-hydrolase, partial [Candidatus Aminicenantes bacterium]|nr:MBL fold metallo-hydrolase [Candidatus Aminicenantes bacterium]